MKQTIEWYEATLRNWQSSLQQDREFINRKLAEMERKEKEFAFALEQLAEAKRRGMDGYDNDKLLIPRKRKA